MNVSVQEHQRSILAAMGIDIWMPRNDVPVRQMQNQLYRDVAVPELLSTLQFQVEQEATETLTAPLSLTLNVKSFTTQTPVVTPDQVEPPVEQSQVDLEQGSIETQEIAAFELQAFCVNHCVIVVNATHLSAEQQQLWLNIQNALIGQYFELKWPFPVLQFQDGRGASMYVQGFLDALKQDKTVLTLGEISHLKNAEITQLASLQEMLEQPILKRRLWQLMQKSQ